MKNSSIKNYALVREVLGGKWKMVILLLLYHKPYRFNKMKQLLGEVSSKVLSDTLGQMCESGLILREDSVYYITEKGYDIGKHIVAILKIIIAK